MNRLKHTGLTGVEKFLLMVTMISKLTVFKQCSKLWFKDKIVFFSCTQLADFGHWIKRFTHINYFPVDGVRLALIFQLPYMF